MKDNWISFKDRYPTQDDAAYGGYVVVRDKDGGTSFRNLNSISGGDEYWKPLNFVPRTPYAKCRDHLYLPSCPKPPPEAPCSLAEVAFHAAQEGVRWGPWSLAPLSMRRMYQEIAETLERTILARQMKACKNMTFTGPGTLRAAVCDWIDRARGSHEGEALTRLRKIVDYPAERETGRFQH